MVLGLVRGLTMSSLPLGENMIELKTIDDWEACVEASKLGPVLVLKHSTACPTSSAGYREVLRYEKDRDGDTPPIYLVKVIESRPVSNAIAQQLGVTHQSPQLILVQNGKAFWDASHYGIQASTIAEAVAEHAAQQP